LETNLAVDAGLNQNLRVLKSILCPSMPMERTISRHRGQNRAAEKNPGRDLSCGEGMSEPPSPIQESQNEDTFEREKPKDAVMPTCPQ